MTPRWLTIEKLVAELGGVCRSLDEAQTAAPTDAVSEVTVNAAVDDATRAVTSVLRDPADMDDDRVVLDAWRSIATAQDAIAGLRRTAVQSRALRDRAQRLQDESLRLRRTGPSSGAGAPGHENGRRRSPGR